MNPSWYCKQFLLVINHVHGYVGGGSFHYYHLSYYLSEQSFFSFDK